jgi:hypothetical protein
MSILSTDRVMGGLYTNISNFWDITLDIGSYRLGTRNWLLGIGYKVFQYR